MGQLTVIRQAIAQNRDIAELMTAGLHGERVMDAADLVVRTVGRIRWPTGRAASAGTPRFPEPPRRSRAAG